MDKIFFLLSMFFTTCSFAQNLQVDSILYDVADKVKSIDDKLHFPERYKLYKTENIYTFLKLDTATGQIDQVQWSLKDGEEGIVPINTTDLSVITENGSFELYPTHNMYQFILLDKKYGTTYHVQWGMKYSERWIRKIE